MELINLNNNFKLIEKYLKQSTQKFCNFTVGEKYMWRDDSEYFYAIISDTLILKESTVEYKNCFYYPLGKDIETALTEIESYCLARNEPLKFCLLSDEIAANLSSRYFSAEVFAEREWSDYVYLAENLRTFSGNKYSGERNHYNKFIRLYPDYKYKIIDENAIPKILAFLEELSKAEFYAYPLEKEEFFKCFDLTKNMFQYGCVGGYIEVGGKVAAYSLGEISGDTFYDHIEKADKNYEGIYQALVKETASAFTGGEVKFINREDDCGDIGLRTSKLRYHPIEIINKNYVVVKTLFDKIAPPILLKTSRLEITDIDNMVGEEYLSLSTAEENNKYWGYDYKENLRGAPSAEYFINFAKNLIKVKEEYPLAVRLSGKLIGEVTMHNFDYYGGVEIGVRIAKEYQGSGYGREAIAALYGYCKDILEAKVIKAKCFKENLSSYKMLKTLNFSAEKKDEKYYYFEKSE